jgi:hypothetical protein
MRRWLGTAVLAVVGWWAAAAGTRAEEESGWKEVTPDDLPAAVIRSLRTDFPKEDIEKSYAGLGRDRGRVRVILRYSSGARVGVVTTEDGTMLAARDLSNEVAIKDLPEKVAQTLKTRFDKSDYSYARQTRAENEPAYEIFLRQDKKYRRGVTINTEGTVLQVRTEIDPMDLPETALAALKDRYPGAKPLRGVKIEAKDKITGYETVVRPEADGAAVIVYFDADGKFVKADPVRRPDLP